MGYRDRDGFELLMIVYGIDIQYISVEFTERAELLIDTKIPYTIFFWFTDFEVYILKISSEYKKFCFFILILEFSSLEVVECIRAYENIINGYHGLEVDKCALIHRTTLLIHRTSLF